MAKSCAMLLVGLVLASTFCAANAGLTSAEPGRKLLLDDLDAVLQGLLPIDVVIALDLTSLSAWVGKGTASLICGVEETVGAVLEAGKECELTAVKVKLLHGFIGLHLRILNVNVVVRLDIAKLKPSLYLGKLKAVLKCVVDKKKKVLQLLSPDGIVCAEINVVI